MKILKIKYILILLTLVSFQACSNDDDGSTEVTLDPIPEQIIINDPGLYPTKFDFNHKNNKFIAGSLTRSNVGYIDSETGNYEVFINDDALISVTEVYTDEIRNRLLVVSGDFGVSENSTTETRLAYAYLGVYNLKTGEKIAEANLHELMPADACVLANGITVDDDGNIYIVDTYSPVIYKVDGTTYEKSIFITDPRFITPVPVGKSPGLIGLTYLDGNLIASKEDEGILFKIPVSNPSAFTEVDGPAFPEVKGLEITSNGNIALTISGSVTPFSGVKILSSDDNWSTATEVSSFEVLPAEKFPTNTAVASDGKLYVINSYLPSAFSGNLMVDFSILLVE